jgi:antitoxin (DNA-binding transcriptional repressor) of toxin-antitoxin stability system
MMEVSVAEAKAKLSELIKRVEAGEDVTITRWGTPVVVMRAPKKPLPSRADLRAKQPPSKISSAELIRQMRDEDY